MSSDPSNTEHFTILMMDADCAVCSESAQLIARWDPVDRFRILPSKTARGRQLLIENGLDPDDPDSWLAQEPDGAVLTDGDVVVSVGRRLSGPWPWLAALFGLFPRFLRDGAYRLIARNRYRIFGRRDLCAAPGPELRRILLAD